MNRIKRDRATLDRQRHLHLAAAVEDIVALTESAADPERGQVSRQRMAVRRAATDTSMCTGGRVRRGRGTVTTLTNSTTTR